MADIHKIEGFVLRKTKLLEKDILVTIFSQEQGKIVTVAKGIKKITSRRAPHIQTGNLVRVLLHSHRDRYYLEQSELISGFTKLKEDPSKIQSLYLFFFILDRILPEGEPETVLYSLTRSFVVELSKIESFPKERMRWYTQQILAQLGYLHEDKPMDELLRLLEEIIHEKIPVSII